MIRFRACRIVFAGIAVLGIVPVLFSNFLFARGDSRNDTGGWTTVATVPLPGPPGRFDYQSLDPRTGYLYIAGMGSDSLLVFNTRKNHLVADLPGFPHAHGVLVLPELHRAYVTVSPEGHFRKGHLAVVDTDSFRTIAMIPTGLHPDGLDRDPSTRRLFVSNEWGKSLTVIDLRTNHAIGTVPLGGEVGNTRLDPSTGQIVSLVQSTGDLVEINPATLKIVRRIPLPCEWPHSLYILVRPHRAFVGCEKDARLLSVNLDNEKISPRLSTGGKPDVLTWDPEDRRLFVASESGIVSVYREQAGTLSEISHRFLGKAAHTILFDPGNRLLYLPLENSGGRPVLRILDWREDGPGPVKSVVPGQSPSP
ncbi:hypothetical protein LptCag_0633 [Leptospirillum ferriphilum]|uniref:YncE family protein n=1 Tax=Leptospirillum ferriphilum TaxID=178606 RepID=A0A094WEH5_9BACT|nr:hypothetical protein [Leptospirillum ferriphilum]KGA94007.1 hypothetical protein LptCag_0633 [Leptospirillum ferriphilum]